jgi:hypothetical protein
MTAPRVVVTRVGGDGGVADAGLPRGADTRDAGVDRCARLDGVQSPEVTGVDDVGLTSGNVDPDRPVGLALDQEAETVVERPRETVGELTTAVGVEKGPRQRRLGDCGVPGLTRQVAREGTEHEREQVLRPERVDAGVEVVVEVPRTQPFPAEVLPPPRLRNALAGDRPVREVHPEDR